MDAGGIPACKKYYQEANATYFTLVDSQNALADALGFKVIPNGFFLDEAGRLVRSIVGGFEVRNARTIEAVETFLAQPKVLPDSTAKPVRDEDRLAELLAKIEADPKNAEARLEAGKILMRLAKAKEALEHLKTAAEALPQSASAQFALGSCMLALDRKTEALAQLRKALALDRENYVIRKQIWMIEHPEKFFPEIDWAWQREQLAKERKAESGGGR